jgi:hypothetical protein
MVTARVPQRDSLFVPLADPTRRAIILAPVWLSRQRRHCTAALDRVEALAAAQSPKRRKS